MRLLLTCEHAGFKIPSEWRKLFRDHPGLLRTHRGWDAGAYDLARKFSKNFNAPLVFGKSSRLLVDLNRTLESPTLFSEFTKYLPEKDQRKIIREVYAPYWQEVRKTLSRQRRGNSPVLHLSFHSFTPVWKKKRRSTDIGLLFDPARPLEKAFCLRLQKALRKNSSLSIHLNRPYRGTGNGVTCQLRRENPNESYGGIEIEVNKKFLHSAAGKNRIHRLLRTAFLETSRDVHST